ncbi:E3 ubiquitin-protein ligase Zswim2, partial [Chelonia mydas]
ILLKKFKIPRNHEYAFQLGLLEGEINDMLQRLQQEQTLSPRANTLSTKTFQKEDDGYINQKEIDAEAVCPICQEELLKKMFPITYCRYSCGNNVHITCMKIWADHQGELESDSVVKCPLCREEFAPLKLILEEFRNSTQLVTAAEKKYTMLATLVFLGALSVVNITYAMNASLAFAILHMFSPFDRECIDNWLLHQKNACPIDGYIVYNPLTWKDISAIRNVSQPGSQTNTTKLVKQMEPELFIPGIGLFFKQTLLGHTLEKSQDSLQRLHNNKDPPHSQQGLTLNGLSYFHLGDSDSSQHNIDRNLSLQFSRYGKDLAHKPFQKILSQKSYSVTSSKDAVSNGTRGLNGTCTNKEKGAKVYHADQANPNKVVAFEDRNNHEISACVRFPGKLNFEDNLGGTIGFTFPKRDNKCVGKARQQRRLLTRPPKHKPLSLKTTEVALLMEGIPLNNKS